MASAPDLAASAFVVASVAAEAIACDFAVATSASVAKSALRVVVIDIPAEPSKFAVPETSPESAIALGVASVDAVDALPVNAAVIVPAAKLPDASRFTTLFATLAESAPPPASPTM